MLPIYIISHQSDETKQTKLAIYYPISFRKYTGNLPVSNTFPTSLNIIT